MNRLQPEHYDYERNKRTFHGNEQQCGNMTMVKKYRDKIISQQLKLHTSHISSLH